MVRREVHPVRVQVLHGRHVFRFEVATMHDQQVVARSRELLDDGAPDESCPTENNHLQIDSLPSVAG